MDGVTTVTDRGVPLEPTTEAADRWHKALRDDPLLPDCSGTHATGYATCQRLAAIDARASQLLTLDVDRLAQALEDADCDVTEGEHHNREFALIVAREYNRP